jgi:hypothetical protein
MADTRQLRQTLAAYNEEGQLYIVVGGLAAVVGWFVPLLSVVAVLCGHRLLSGERHRLVGATIMGFGVLALLDVLLRMAAVL